MILIVGGAFQGKRDFAARRFMASSEGNPGEGAAGKDGFADGREVSWEVFCKAKYACGLHSMIWRKLKAGQDGEELEKVMARQLVEGCPDRILIMDEIGCGIVPADAFERQYRELAGRNGCKLAAEADEVWRVAAGIGKRLR